MSVQTGEAVPEGPASARLADRARFRVDKLLKDPNPLWMRELRQSTRLQRTPYILMSVTVITTLIIAGVGGSVGQAARIDTVGQALYHTFFSLSFFLVALAGPALAANAIASEREGRTWEAVILTGMSPQLIARGKFLAAFTAVASYVVVMAPVGALCFLFGGVDWLEVMIAFAYLFVLSILSVAFGLAVSSRMPTARSALLVTLLLSVPISGFVYGTFGPALSIAVHGLWERVPQGVPVWLPVAYVRGEFGVAYILILFVVPVLAIALPAWFLYEATVANLTEPTDDRSSGLKRWFIVATTVLALSGAAGLLPLATADGVMTVAVFEIIALLCFLLFCLTVFMGDPLESSRRIRYRWDQIGATKLARWLGPCLERTFKLVLGAGMFAFCAVVGTAVLRSSMLPSGGAYVRGAVLFAAYMVSFFVFSAGLSMLLRARSNNLFGARLVFLVILGGLAIVPWIVAAVAGVAFRSSEAALALAAPSPFFGALLLSPSPPPAVALAGMVMTAGWTLLGLFFFVTAAAKSRKIIDQYEVRLAQAEALLAAEDAMAQSTIEPEPAAPAPEEPKPESPVAPAE